MRLELSGKTELALRALHVLCENGLDDTIRGQDLAEAVQTTTHYLPQVMHPLVRAGWVSSSTGPTGGYRLVVEPTDISLLQVIEAVEGPVPDGTCVLRGAPCPVQEPCVLHEPWTRARGALLAELDSTPVSDGRCRLRTKEGSDA